MVLFNHSKYVILVPSAIDDKSAVSLIEDPL